MVAAAGAAEALRELLSRALALAREMQVRARERIEQHQGHQQRRQQPSPPVSPSPPPAPATAMRTKRSSPRKRRLNPTPSQAATAAAAPPDTSIGVDVGPRAEETQQAAREARLRDLKQRVASTLLAAQESAAAAKTAGAATIPTRSKAVDLPQQQQEPLAESPSPPLSQSYLDAALEAQRRERRQGRQRKVARPLSTSTRLPSLSRHQSKGPEGSLGESPLRHSSRSLHHNQQQQLPHVFRAKAHYTGESFGAATTDRGSGSGSSGVIKAKTQMKEDASLAGIASAAGSREPAERGKGRTSDVWVWPALSGTYRMPGAKEAFVAGPRAAGAE